MWRNFAKTGHTAISKSIRLALSCSPCYKTLFGGNIVFPKIKKIRKSVLMSEAAQICKKNAIFSAKLFSETVYCFYIYLFLLFQFMGKF